MPGSVTERGRLLSPTRTVGGLPLWCVLRSRNDGTVPVFFLKRGKPTRLPLRLPRRESDHALSPFPRSTAASSNTCWHTSARQVRPVTTVVRVPSASTLNTRPASSLLFQALNELIRSNPVHGTPVSWCALGAVSAAFTVTRHWLNANRDAPACRTSSARWPTVGSRQNLNVVWRDITGEHPIAH